MGRIRQSIARESGFTLVELLVAIGVFGVVMGVVLQVFRVNYRNYALQEDVAEMQQNVRVAKMFLARDIRMAGAGIRGFNYNGAPLYAVSYQNGTGENGSDILTIHYTNFENEGCGTPTGSNPACDTLPQLTLVGTMPPTSTTADVSASGVSVPRDVLSETSPINYSLWTGDCECEGITYGANPNDRFKAIITSPDGLFSDVVYITGTGTTGSGDYDNLANGPNYTGSDGVTWPNSVLNTYPAGSTISFFYESEITKVVYRINGAVLQRSAQNYQNSEVYDPIAENIEDMQLAFGLDTDADGDVDTWINNIDLTDTQKSQVRLVRLNLLAQTPGIHPMVTGKTYSIEDHTAGSVDQRKRKLLTTTIKVRNLG